MFSRIKKWLKWGLLLLWFIAMLLIGIKLAQQNQDLVQLKLLLWQMPEASSGVVFGITLLMGILLGLVVFYPGYYLLKVKYRRTQKKLQTLQDSPPPVQLPKA